MTFTNRNCIGHRFDTSRKPQFPMQSFKLLVWVSVLVTKICFAGLIDKTSERDKWRLVDATVDILESCYTDRFSTVGVAGPSAGSITTKLSSRDTPIPAITIDENPKVGKYNLVELGYRHKLQIFVIMTTDKTALDETLTQVRRSKWWNHMASFLLIDWPGGKNGCWDAPEILWEAWKMNLLNSKFVCLDRTRGPMIYTFNPYTSKAPGPWQQWGVYGGINGHIWTIFKRQYREDESRCDKLDFDKTVDLGRYKICMCIDPPTSDASFVQTQLFFVSLNASFFLFRVPDVIVQVDRKNLKSIGAYKEVADGLCDILMDPIINQHCLGLEYTYLFKPSSIAILTQYPRYKSQLEKIASVLDVRSRYGVLVVLIITLGFFKLWLREPLIPAILELVLLICNAGFRRIPRETAPRIYLAGLFVFVVTIQGIYSGQLASLLTKKVRLPPIDTLEDLARSDHIIYGYYHVKPFLDRRDFEERFVEVRDDNCQPDVERSENAACISTRDSFYLSAAEHKLHISRETIGVNFAGYAIRPDWPLEDRINLMLGQFLASGILKLQYSRKIAGDLRAIEAYDNQEQEPDVAVLTLEMLKFAFVILAIGLGCATVTFIIEVATFETAIARPRKRLRRIVVK